MAQVVIIHALEDTLPARALAEKLRRAELDVELEKSAGAETRQALGSAALAIALWSPKSVGLQNLIEDVAYARERGRVLHAVMQNAAAPAQFHQDRGVNLTGWRGEADFPAWRQLTKFVAEVAGLAPPPPAPQPESGFFSPGRAAAAAGAPNPVREHETAPLRPTAQPTANEPRAVAPKHGLALAALAIAALGGAGGGYYFWSQSRTPPEEAASPLDELDPNDAASLRALINAGSGELAGRAQQALNDLEERSFEAASDADIAELEAFLSEFPRSSHAVAARKRLEELRRAAAAQEQQSEPPGEPSGAAENAAQEGEPALGEPPSHDDVQQPQAPAAAPPPA